jgi:hypothetical protein
VLYHAELGGPFVRASVGADVTVVRVHGGPAPLHPKWLVDALTAALEVDARFEFMGWGDWIPASDPWTMFPLLDECWLAENGDRYNTHEDASAAVINEGTSVTRMWRLGADTTGRIWHNQVWPTIEEQNLWAETTVKQIDDFIDEYAAGGPDATSSIRLATVEMDLWHDLTPAGGDMWRLRSVTPLREGFAPVRPGVPGGIGRRLLTGLKFIIPTDDLAV